MFSFLQKLECKRLFVHVLKYYLNHLLFITLKLSFTKLITKHFLLNQNISDRSVAAVKCLPVHQP